MEMEEPPARPPAAELEREPGCADSGPPSARCLAHGAPQRAAGIDLVLAFIHLFQKFTERLVMQGPVLSAPRDTGRGEDNSVSLPLSRRDIHLYG